jgi:sugar phosphate isomerase/epimerase
MNEIGMCAAVFGDLPLGESLDAVTAAGFDCIDLPTDTPFRMLREWCDGSVSGAAVRRQLDERGIRVACVSNSRDSLLLLGPHGPHTDGVRRGTPDEKRAYGRDAAMRAIDLAAEVGAPLVRLAFGCPDFGRWLEWQGSDVGWRDNVEAFAKEARAVIERARAGGLRLCVETHPKQIVFDFASALTFLEVLEDDLDVLSLCVDPANLATVGCRAEPFLRAVAGHVSCVHVKDVEIWDGEAPPPREARWVRYGPQPPIRFRGMGWGRLDWPNLVTVLVEIGYGGPYFVEHEDVFVRRDLGLVSARERLTALVAAGGSSPRTW